VSEPANRADGVATAARRDVACLPAYNAGLSAADVRERYQVTRIAKLNSNENPFGPSPRAISALTAFAADAALYPDGGCSSLKKDLSGFLGVDADRLIVGNGSENIIELACLAFLNPGDRVITLGPSFGLHEIYARAMSASVEKIEVGADLQFDLPSWWSALRTCAKIVMFSNPSNPVGCILRTAEFRDLIRRTPADSVLVVDEAYYEFAQGAEYPDSIRELDRQDRPWLVLRTFSKAYGLAGLRVGYGIASSPDVVRLLDRVRTPFNVNSAAQIAAAAALQDQDHVARSVRGIVGERIAMRRDLIERGYEVAESHANFLFIKVRDDAQLCANRLMARGVVVKPWRDPGYARYIRVSIGSPADNGYFLAVLRDVNGH
jgi:histidinol-phosphate aminotransferase